MEKADKSSRRSRSGGSGNKHGRRRCFGAPPSLPSPMSLLLLPLLLLLLLLSFLDGRIPSPAAAAVVVSAEKSGGGIVVDAETGGECVDSDPASCPFWAATGECRKNKGYMHVHCKKSCDRCNVVRVQNRAEIDRFMAAKQKEIEEKRRIRALEKEALTALKTGGEGTGGDGLAIGGGGDDDGSESTTTTTKTKTQTTTSAVVGSDGTIEPGGGGDGAIAATTTSSNSNSNNAVEKPKPLTIRKEKKAKIDAETGLECVDLDAECPFWAATGDCKTNRNFMSRNCRLSCDRCHIVRVNSQAEMQNYIQQKTRETEHRRAARKQARQVQKVLSGGEL